MEGISNPSASVKWLTAVRRIAMTHAETLPAVRRAICLILGLTVLAAAGCVGPTPPPLKLTEPVSISLPRQPSEPMLLPGLGVIYFDRFFTHVDQMPGEQSAHKTGRKGSPIGNLNHRFGKGKVFDSGRSQGVGVQIAGFIRMSTPGTYEFKARSNDGIRVFLGDTMIIDDPAVHSDRFSNEKAVEIRNSGWYPLKILYFQKKGTATIELFWKEPSVSVFQIVPPGALAHSKGE
jgi:hypothetical protein